MIFETSFATSHNEMRQALIPIAFLLLLSSCGWRQKSESASPNGVNRVILLQQRVLQMGGGLQIKFISDSKAVYTEKLIGDVYINFIEYLWSKDSTRVALYINGLQRKGFAYDFATRREIPFNEMKMALGDKIRHEYHLSNREDPFRCDKCTDSFIKEHPSEVTY